MERRRELFRPMRRKEERKGGVGRGSSQGKMIKRWGEMEERIVLNGWRYKFKKSGGGNFWTRQG